MPRCHSWPAASEERGVAAPSAAAAGGRLDGADAAGPATARASEASVCPGPTSRRSDGVRFEQALDAVGEAHGPPQVPHPVLRVGGLGVRDPLPVTFDTNGCGRRVQATPRTRARNSSSTRVHHRRVERVRGAQAAVTRGRARASGASNASTSRRARRRRDSAGALTAASESAVAESGDHGAGSPSGTASMAPSGIDCIRRPRRHERQRVLEREHARPGRRPRTRRCCGRASRRARRPTTSTAARSAYSTTKRAGCANVGPRQALGGLRSASGGNSTARRSTPAPRAGGEAVVHDRAERPARSRRASRPMPAYCAPCPGTGTRPGAAPASCCVRAAARGSRSAATASAVPRTRRRAGAEDAPRPDCSVNATSPSGSPGCASRCAASRSAAASRAVALRAESTSSCTGRSTRRVGGRRRLLEHDVRVGAADAEGADRRPARRGAAPRRPVGAAGRAHDERDSSRSRSRGSALEVQASAASRGARSASTALMRPATPAAASRWPMLRLDRADRAELPAVAARGGTPCVSAAISIGSPSACRCRAPRRSRSCRLDTPARASASAITAGLAARRSAR